MPTRIEIHGDDATVWNKHPRKLITYCMNQPLDVLKAVYRHHPIRLYCDEIKSPFQDSEDTMYGLIITECDTPPGTVIHATIESLIPLEAERLEGEFSLEEAAKQLNYQFKGAIHEMNESGVQESTEFIVLYKALADVLGVRNEKLDFYFKLHQEDHKWS